jgi:hypothetical protein
MDAAANIQTAKLYLRRTYAANVAGLKTLANTIAADAFEAVTLTGQSFEGSSHTGQLVFARIDYLRACEELILELDTALPRPVIQTQAVFRAFT